MAITINNLIGGSINIVTGGGTSERWVPAVYTDEWVSSDGKTLNNIIFGPSGPENLPFGNYSLPAVYRASGNTYDATSLFQGNYNDSTESDKIVKMEFNDSTTGEVSLTIYRKYTPGHWEDANGNWINGNWGAWSNKSIKGWGEYYYWDENKNEYFPSGKYAWMYNDMEPITIEKGSHSYNTDENYYTTVLYGWKFGEEYIVANRTWNNTKPAA